ncbi:hypothetical protein [Streptomyces sp. NPDC048266]|uniref:hypothetical protein n=1 Tax=Streptomyces sp. NPDC048266 TaxID=3155787 RepID=UPI0033FDB300
MWQNGLVEDIFKVHDEQTVIVPGPDAATPIVPSPASSLTAVLDQLAARIEKLLEAHRFRGPGLHARHRGQDLGPYPDRCR